MRREQRDPSSYSHSTIKPVSEGGTGTSVLDNFITTLDIVVDDPTDPNGPVIINPDGTIPTDVFPSSIPPIPSVDGPKSLFASQTGTFTITNYDSDATYSLSALAGNISRDDDVITYIAPSTTGISGFRLDGRLINVDVVSTGVSTPIAISPVNNTNNLNSSVTFTGKAFAVISQSDTHAMSDWELATDSEFLNVVKSEYSSVTNKTTWSVNGLTPNTVYYLRMRYKGNSLGYSAWSPPITVSTKNVFIPSLETAKLQTSDRTTNDYFGNSVAISSDGNTAIIGAYSKGSNTGEAYIFTRSGTSWSQQQKLQASDRAVDDRFSYSVAISSDGNTAIIGANTKDSPEGPNTGAVYIFTRSGTSWTEQAKLQASDRVASDQFGITVAISGDGNTAIIGAHGKDSPEGSDTGTAYIFTRSGTSWSQQQKLQASDRVAGDSFGNSVAISSDGNTAIIGAVGKDSPEGSNTGAVYIFTRSGTTWTEQAKIQASDRAASDRFGNSIAISSDNNTVFIGASGKNTRIGAAYIFTRSGTSWTEQAKLQASDSRATNDQFGYSVAISGDGNTAIIGAHGKDSPEGSNTGAAYIYS